MSRPAYEVSARALLEQKIEELREEFADVQSQIYVLETDPLRYGINPELRRLKTRRATLKHRIEKAVTSINKLDQQRLPGFWE